MEKIIADNLPDADLNTENYLIGVMQNIVAAYQEDYINKKIMPMIVDPCIECNDLLAGYMFSDFETFISELSSHIELIEKDGTTNEVWRAILGMEFPKGEALTHSSQVSVVQSILNVPHRQKPEWRTPSGAAVMINAQITYPSGLIAVLENDGNTIPKKCSLIYKTLHSIKQPYHLRWQIVNTGEEAKKENGLRGGFEDSDVGQNGKKETTAYKGKHYVQCFVIKGGQCVAKSKEFIINIE